MIIFLDLSFIPLSSMEHLYWFKDQQPIFIMWTGAWKVTYLLYIFIEEVKNTVIIFCFPPSFYMVIPGTPKHWNININWASGGSSFRWLKRQNFIQSFLLHRTAFIYKIYKRLKYTTEQNYSKWLRIMLIVRKALFLKNTKLNTSYPYVIYFQ